MQPMFDDYIYEITNNKIVLLPLSLIFKFQQDLFNFLHVVLVHLVFNVTYTRLFLIENGNNIFQVLRIVIFVLHRV